MSEFNPEKPVFDSSLPIRSYASHIAQEFSDLARHKREELLLQKFKAGAIYTGNPDSPSGYERRLLSPNPDWYSELYRQHNWTEERKIRPGSKLRRGSRGNRKIQKTREVVRGPIERIRVLNALGRIELSTDLGTNLHAILREHIFYELINPEKYDSFPVQGYFGLIIEEPFEQVPIEYY